MTLERGINRENRDGDRTCLLLQKGQSLQLVADFTISGDREIYGVAHVPTIDRENEIILSDAIREALPQYMELPILHVQHTERPVGTVTKALVDDEGKLHLYGKIKETPDTDDVWEDILKGELNKFSVFGKRLIGTPECAISPGQRYNPCITKAMHLFSISIVGDNAMNQDTFLKVAKAYNSESDGMEEEEKKDDKEEVEKCGKVCTKGDEEEQVEKSDEPALAHEPTNISSIMSRLDGLEKSFTEFTAKKDDEVEKSEEGDDKMEEDKKKDETVEKAAPVVEDKVEVSPAPEYVVKAELTQYITKAEFDTISKAYTELKDRVDKMEKETIEKGGNVVIIQNDFMKDNPHMGNLDSIGA